MEASQQYECSCSGSTYDIAPFNEMPLKTTKIYVGGLDKEATWEDLEKYFIRFGEVTDIIVFKGPPSSRVKAFGFVSFARSASVKCVLSIKLHHINGAPIEIKSALVAQTMRKILVDGIGADTTESELLNYFEQFGKVQNVEFSFDNKNLQRRQFCFVNFVEEATVNQVCKRPKHKIGDRTCDVRKATIKQYRQSVASVLQYKRQFSGATTDGRFNLEHSRNTFSPRRGNLEQLSSKNGYSPKTGNTQTFKKYHSPRSNLQPFKNDSSPIGDNLEPYKNEPSPRSRNIYPLKNIYSPRSVNLQPSIHNSSPRIGNTHPSENYSSPRSNLSPFKNDYSPRRSNYQPSIGNLQPFKTYYSPKRGNPKIETISGRGNVQPSRSNATLKRDNLHSPENNTFPKIYNLQDSGYDNTLIRGIL